MNDMHLHQKITEYELDEVLMWVFGFFGPMPILYIAGNTLFTYLLFLTVGWSVFSAVVLQKGTLAIRLEWAWVASYTALLFVSAILCLIGPLEAYWKSGILSKLILAVVYLVFFCFYAMPERRRYAVFFLRGVQASAFFQMLWGYAQFLLYHSKRIVLNEVVIRDMLHIKCPTGYAVFRNGELSISGLSDHPYTMAPLMCIGFCSTRSLLLKCAFVGIAFISGSRTAILGIAVCAVVQAMQWKRSNKSYIRVKPAYAIACLLLVSGGLVYMLRVNTVLIDRIISLVAWSAESLKGNDGSFQAHAGYWRILPQAIEQASVLQFLFGYGPGCSGYVGSSILHLYEGNKWVLECEYLEILWSYGLLGLLTRYVFYVRECIVVVKKNSRYLALLLAIAIMGITYNFLHTWGLLFLYCMIIYYGRSGAEQPIDKVE